MESTVVFEVTRGKLVERRVVRECGSAQGDVRSCNFRFESVVAKQTRCNGIEASEENMCSGKAGQILKRKCEALDGYSGNQESSR